jgi:phosphate transport system protein
MPKKHTLESFDEDLAHLRAEVLSLAERAETQLEQAIAAMLNDDVALAQEVISSDVEADRQLQRVNGYMTIVLARQQAVADDLREILAAGRIAAHLERLADYAKNSARRMLAMAEPADAEAATQFKWMADRVIAMLRQVMNAYQERDAGEANVAWSSDVELDRVYGDLFGHILQRMQQDPHAIKDATQLLFIAKGLERCGDHVTDIAEEVYLMVTGIPLLGPRPKLDNIVPA